MKSQFASPGVAGPIVLLVALTLLVACAPGMADQGLRAQFYRDTQQDWGAFGSDTTSPQPYWIGILPNIDQVFANSLDQYFSMRAQGYLYVPANMAGDIEFKTVSDDGARLYIDGNRIINFWRLQSHQTIGTPTDECTHTATVNLTAGYHAIEMDYFEWEGGENDPDPCKLYWNGQIIPTANLFTEQPPASGLAISNVSAAPSPFNPTASQTCAISYNINLTANITIEILDASGAVVRTAVNNAARSAGQNSDSWDGRNDSGAIVPNGAWTYRITARLNGDVVIYDPGAPPPFAITDLNCTSPFAPMMGQHSTITYTLPCAARVRIRMGGTMMGMIYTVVDWQVRQAGPQTDTWDGHDNGQYIVPGGDYQCAIWALPVAVNSIVTTGA